jgi:hypothetical protein
MKNILTSRVLNSVAVLFFWGVALFLVIPVVKAVDIQSFSYLPRGLFASFSFLCSRMLQDRSRGNLPLIAAETINFVVFGWG